MDSILDITALSQTPSVDDATIQRITSRRELEAGRFYAARGQVRNLVVTGGGRMLQAETQGTALKPYRQEIALRPERDGRLGFSGACTCPVGHNCKHVAAVLIAGRTKLAPTRAIAKADPVPPLPPQEAQLPYNVSAWLQSLEGDADTASEDYPASVRQRLFYILAPGAATRGVPPLSVACLTATLRKDGSLGAARVYAPHQVDTPARYLRPSDRSILRRLARMRYGAGELGLDDDPAELLRRIIATGRARWAGIDGPALHEEPARPGRIGWQLDEIGNQHAGMEVEAGLVGLRLNAPWYVDPASGATGPLDIDLPSNVAARLLAAPPIPAEFAPKVSAELARRLPALAVPTLAVLPPPQVLHGPVRPHLRLMQGTLPFNRALTGSRHAAQGPIDTPLARLAFGYGPVTLSCNRQPSPEIIASGGTLYRIERDRQGERAALARLGGIGFAQLWDILPPYMLHGDGNDFALDDDESGAEWIDVLIHEVPALVADGWTVEIDPDFPIRLATPDSDIDAELIEGSGIDWLELHLGVMVDGKRVDLVPALVRLIAGSGGATLIGHDDDHDDEPFVVPLPDGRLLSIPFGSIRPTLLALTELFSVGGIDIDAGKVTFTRHDAADLAALEERTGIAWRGGEALRALGRQLRGAGDAIPPVSLPETFHGVLRPYQAQGVAWLQFLCGAGLGGVLADDMGLGKTVQTLAHLAIEQAQGRLDRPALIVCPTSLIPNWILEAERFAPRLKLLSLHGPARKERFADIESHDLVLTTYPLLTRDHEVLTAQGWHSVILDEAQMIKNPTAATTRQALRLKAGQRICLSGTPLQNHLGELWSLFDFLAPGFLGSSRSFRSRYRTPIEKHGDEERQRILSRRVRPFLLRRTKEEVLGELPPKTEIPEWIEMGAGQRALYEGIRLAMHARVKAAIAERGLARSGIIILDALLKLRQACCDPKLLKLKAARQANVGTAKLDRLMNLLEVLLGEGRRILIFSQFTSMLALIEEQLSAAGSAYVLLTGDTKDRTTPVRRFQSGKVPVFLISLKAGGVGLNLTAADTVIHYDPWWNPAVEDQATDRAHRIGQDKNVFVHRLITLGSIEEKMEGLKDKKRALVASVLDAEHGGALKLTEADVEALFAPA